MSELIPRLSPDEMPPELARHLRPRMERLGYLGEFFRCAAHQPRALLSFMAFTDDLKEALPDRLTELVALTVSGAMGNEYERVQHERLSLKLGFGEAWIREAEAVSPVGSGALGLGLTEDERLVQRLVLVLVERKGHNTRVELEAVVRAIGAPHAVAVLLLAGRYVTHALMANALALAPPVASPLDPR